MRDDSLNLKRAREELVELELLLGTQRVHLLQQSYRTCDSGDKDIYTRKNPHTRIMQRVIHKSEE